MKMNEFYCNRCTCSQFNVNIDNNGRVMLICITCAKEYTICNTVDEL